MTENETKILAFLTKRESATAPQLAEHLHLSRQRAFVLLTKLVHEGKAIRIGERRGRRYAVPNIPFEIRDRIELSLENKKLKEHEVLMDIRDRFVPLKLAPENVKSIFDYAFSEMLNNAIEHSKSPRITVEALVSGHTASGSPTQFSFTVRDYGIGAFRNLMQKRSLTSELEAMQDLLKGKVTTAPEAHSGQGIFFTSKVADRFSLRSYGWEMRVDNTVPDIFFLADEVPVEGTEVRFDIDYHSARHLIDVFRRLNRKTAHRTSIGQRSISVSSLMERYTYHGPRRDAYLSGWINLNASRSTLIASRLSGRRLLMKYSECSASSSQIFVSKSPMRTKRFNLW